MPNRIISSVSSKDLARVVKVRSNELGCDNTTVVEDKCIYKSQDITDYCDSCLLCLIYGVLNKEVKLTNGSSEV